MSDQERFTDWSGEGLTIVPSKVAPAAGPSVQYKSDMVVAYIDDQGRPATPEEATQARVWTKGVMRTVRLKP